MSKKPTARESTIKNAIVPADQAIPMIKRNLSLFPLLIVVFLTACNSSNTFVKDPAVADNAALKNNNNSLINCDSFAMDRQPVKDYKKALSVWLETTSLDWFLEKRQSAWREAKAWDGKIFPVDSNAIIKCISDKNDAVFLYIPNHYYIKEKKGNEFFQFFIVNNSGDTLKIPRLDDVISNISSSVAFAVESDTLRNWLSFQQTNTLPECGNSTWTMELPPKTAIESLMESRYIGLGDTAVDYRIELTLGKKVFVSNSIKINLMKKQLPYLGKKE